jgi:hypothetical protein
VGNSVGEIVGRAVLGCADVLGAAEGRAVVRLTTHGSAKFSPLFDVRMLDTNWDRGVFGKLFMDFRTKSKRVEA